MDSRVRISQVDWEWGLRVITDRLNVNLLDERKNMSWIGPHETLGKITEEYHELIEAIHRNHTEHTREELIDIAICALKGIVSMNVNER